MYTMFAIFIGSREQEVVSTGMNTHDDLQEWAWAKKTKQIGGRLFVGAWIVDEDTERVIETAGEVPDDIKRRHEAYFALEN